MEFKRLSGKHKNSKILYYIKGYGELLFPSFLYKHITISYKEINSRSDLDYINQRVNYYNKMKTLVLLPAEIETLASIYKRKRNTYFFDLRTYSRFFDSSNKTSALFGDITHIPNTPSLTKSRPIKGENVNSVLFKLNKIRHFLFINDSKPFEHKKNTLLSRGKVHPLQKNRIKFLEMYHNHPLCDVGKVNANELNPAWLVNRMTIDKQLDYKFILSLEGNDVASNLKWVMSSNSIAVMPKPKYETWFMEGTLIPDYHYIAIKDDFTDLEEKLSYYITNTEKALAIIENANQFVAQFKNAKREDAISFKVLEKYFEMTGQSTELKY